MLTEGFVHLSSLWEGADQQLSELEPDERVCIAELQESTGPVGEGWTHFRSPHQKDERQQGYIAAREFPVG